MLAVVLREVPGQLAIDDVKVGTIGPNDVLIRTAAAGLCHSDLHVIEGAYPAITPVVMGHESAGVVLDVGTDVRYVQPGDHVVTCLSIFCGECEFCLTGRPALCDRVGLQRDPSLGPRLVLDDAPCQQHLGLGSFAEEMLVHERSVVKISTEMPLEKAALIGCAVTTGLGAVFRTAAVGAGSTVAVIGCGGVGLSCIEGARLAGAARIVAVDRSLTRLSLAQRLGATDLLDVGQVDDPVAAVQEMFPSAARAGLPAAGVEFAFEAVGTSGTVEQAFRMTRKGGTATLIGMVPIGQMIQLHGADFLLEKRIQGSSMGSNRFRHDVPRYVDLYLQGRLRLDELVSDMISIHEISEGFQRMKAGEGARTVVRFPA
jgi:S-(hydroxymethyl)glutathione dehydrogenase/alcohol dehydrogenase